MRACGLAWVVVALLAGADDSSAANLGLRWPGRASDLLAKADAARRSGDLDGAEQLLAEAEAAGGGNAAAFLYARGLLMRDRGKSEVAADLLGRAADAAPQSDARVDLAALFVQLGRWPEAVVTLRAAFLERGGTLRAEDVRTDVRFAPLVGFHPYDELIQTVREEQAGLVGRLLIRIEAIEKIVREAEALVDRVNRIADQVLRVVESPAWPPAAFILLVLVISAGVGQMRIVPAPWTVVLAFALCAALWAEVVHLVSEDGAYGETSIGIGAAAILGPVFIGMLVRGVRRRRRATSELRLP